MRLHPNPGLPRPSTRVSARFHCAALAVALAGGAAQARQSHTYAGVERELVLDAARIAVHDAHADANAIAERLAAHGVTSADVLRWPIRDWWLVTLPPTHRTRAGVDHIVDAIVADPRFEFVTPIYVGDDGGPLFPTRDLLVGSSGGAPIAGLEADLASRGSLRDRRFGGMEGVYRVECATRDGRRVLAAANELVRTTGVSFAEPEMVFTGRGDHIPNDAGFPICWGLHNVGQSGGTADRDMDGPEAWDISIGDPSVIVVVLDNGVQQDHPDIHQIPGVDTTSDGPSGLGGPRNAFDNHGTPVAGCISATIDNDLGTVGIAPGCVTASARTFIATAADGSWTSLSSWTVASLAWAESIGARVTNNSNGYGFQSGAIATKYQTSWNNGLVHFAAAGNNGTQFIAYPASIPVVNAVGALERQGTLASFSNFGVGLDFTAPGLDVYSTDRTGSAGYAAGDFSLVYGTSFASPYAAGVAALVIGALPSANSATVEQILRDSCVDLGAPGYDTTFGNGFVNARNALVATCETPSNFCTTSPNSVGPGAVMSSNGPPSIALNGLTLVAAGCPPNSAGIFYFGTSSASAPFGNGLRCVGGSTFRLSIVAVNLFGDATYAPDLHSLPGAAGVAPGVTRYFQFWYRNPAGGGAGFNLSDGLRVQFCP